MKFKVYVRFADNAIPDENAARTMTGYLTTRGEIEHDGPAVIHARNVIQCPLDVNGSMPISHVVGRPKTTTVHVNLRHVAFLEVTEEG